MITLKESILGSTKEKIKNTKEYLDKYRPKDKIELTNLIREEID